MDRKPKKTKTGFPTTPENDIKNKENAEFVNEVAFNKGIKPKKVTQEMFNERYVENSPQYKFKPKHNKK